jgi:hypothetical protein
MKPLLGQQIVEVVAGNPARDLGVAPPDLVAVALDELFQP